MINPNLITCDQCKQTIDPATGMVEFSPVRGGLNLIVTNSIGNAGVLINKPVHLHRGTVDCVAPYLDEKFKAIKPAPKAPVKPAAAPAAAPAEAKPAA